MTESTCVEAGAPTATSQRRSTSAREQRRAMRGELMWRIEERALGAVMVVEPSGPPRFGSSGAAVAQITSQAALILASVWRERRAMSPGDAATFHLLGDLAARTGLSEDEAVAAVEVAAEALLDLMRRDAHGPWSMRTRAAVLGDLETQAQAFTEAASCALRLGMSGEVQHNHDRAGVLLRALDGRLAGDELGAAASAVGLDASREHGIVLLVHLAGRASALEAAARDVEVRIPYAVDLGLGDNLPIHRRMVLPVLTHGRWVEARAHLHDVATRHRLLAIAPAAAPTLVRLAEAYRETEQRLERVVAECGYTSGIIDPACVAPTTAAVTAAARNLQELASPEADRASIA